MEYTGKVHRNPLFWLAKPLLGKFWATGYHGAKASPYLDDEKVRSCRRTKVTPTLAGKSGERHAPLYVGTSTPVTCPAALPRPSGAPARPRLSQAWPGSKRADPRDCRHPDRQPRPGSAGQEPGAPIGANRGAKGPFGSGSREQH